MDKSKQLIEPLGLDEEELHKGIEEIDVEDVEPITQLPKCISPRKSTAKVPKDPDSVKFMVSTPLLVEIVLFEGQLLAWIQNLKMEDWDLGDHDNFPQLVPSKYLKKVYYEESYIMRLEPMSWVAGVGRTVILNMLWVSHFSRTNINTIFVH